MKDRERDTLSWILMALVIVVAAVGSTIEVPDRYPSQVVDDSARGDLIRFEDGSWSDGYCEAGALCDDTEVTP
jgi:hypothetical protein